MPVHRKEKIMRGMKKLTALLLAACMLFGLVGIYPDAFRITAEAAPAEKNGHPADREKDPGKLDKKEDGDSYTLTLVLGVGQKDKKLSYEQNSLVDLSKIEKPRLPGYEFTGWYQDEYLFEPCEDAFYIHGNMAIYAAYRSDGSTFSAYQADMPWDTEFVLYSKHQLTEDTLEYYVEFDDVYNDTVTISLEEIYADPNPVQPTADHGPVMNHVFSIGDDGEITESEEEPEEKEPPLPPAPVGEFKYRLYSENGFGQGQLYSLTVKRPDLVNFLSAGAISLSGNDAVNLNFHIIQEDIDNREMNTNVKQLKAEDLLTLEDLGDFKYRGTFPPELQLEQEDVLQIPGNETRPPMNLVVLEKEKETEAGTDYLLRTAASGELWAEYELTTSTSKIQNPEDLDFEMDQENVDATMRAIETSIGMAAYIDSSLDSLRHNPKVMEFMEGVSQEDYDAFMNLRAVDLGYGPLELRDEATSVSFGWEKLGKMTADYGLTDDSQGVHLEIVYESPKLPIKLGRNGKIQGEIELYFTIAEALVMRSYSYEVMAGTYPSLDEDYLQTHIMPDSTTTIQFNATMALTDLPVFGKTDDGNQGSTEESTEPTETEEPTEGSTESDSQNNNDDTHETTGRDEEDSTHETTDRDEEDSTHETTGHDEEDNTHETTENEDSTQDQENSEEGESNPTETGDTTNTESTEEPTESTTEMPPWKIKRKEDWDIDTYGNRIETKLDLSMAQHDIYTYIEAMQEQLVNNDEYYDVDLDPVPFIRQRIVTFPNLTITGIDSIQISVDFIVALAASAKFTGTFSYQVVSDIYTSNGKMIFGENGRPADIKINSDGSTTQGSRVVQSNLRAGVSLQGGIGIEAGLGLNVTFSALGLNPIYSVGISAEVGGYTSLIGYMAYEFNHKTQLNVDKMIYVDKEYDETTTETNVFKGGVKAEAGIYLRVSSSITYLMIRFSHDWIEEKFPLWQKELGAFSIGEDAPYIYGDFINDKEWHTIVGGEQTVSLRDLSGKDLAPAGRQGGKTRSCLTENSTPLELADGGYFGDLTKSSGLNLYRGQIERGKDPERLVSAVTLPAGEYSYDIVNVSVQKGVLLGKRYIDGSLMRQFGNISPDDCSRYVTLENGNLKFQPGCPTIQVAVRVRALNVEDIFTQTAPEKIFYFTYINPDDDTGFDSADADGYQINFHDTDGNLLITDHYEQGEAPVQFPEPGYKCYSYGTDTFWVGFAGPQNLSKEEKAELEKLGIPAPPDVKPWATIDEYRANIQPWNMEKFGYTLSQYGWKQTMEQWSYSPDKWDLDSAYWADKDGNEVTSDTVSRTGATDLYLKMDPAFKQKANWRLYYLNPDDGVSTVEKEVAYTCEYGLGKMNSLYTVPGPDLKQFSKQIDGEEMGGVAYFDTWQLVLDNLNELEQEVQSVPIFTIHPWDTFDKKDGYKLHLTDGKTKFVKRTVPVASVDVAHAYSKFTYLWENVYFEKDGERIAVRTEEGKVPQIPEKFRTSDVQGWHSELTNDVTTEIPALENDGKRHENIVYRAVNNVQTLVFDGTDFGTVSGKFWGDENTWYSNALGDSWKYMISDDGTQFTVLYTDCTKDSSAGAVNPLTPDLDLSVIYPGFPAKIGETEEYARFSWVATEEIGGQRLTFRENGRVNLHGIKWPSGGKIVLKPQFDKRGVTVKIRGTQEKFGGTEDMGFLIFGRKGETLDRTRVMDILSGKVMPAESYGPFHYRLFILSVDDGSVLPYEFGQADHGNTNTLFDTVAIDGEWNNESRIDLGRGSLTDGTTGIMTRSGSNREILDLGTLSVQSPVSWETEDGFTTEWRFDGWRNTEGKAISSIRYGEDAKACWIPTGRAWFDLTFDAKEGFFSDGSRTKTIRFESDRCLKEIPGYEIPTAEDEAGQMVTFWYWADESGTEVPDTTDMEVFAGRGHIIHAVYRKGTVPFTVRNYHGIYDGEAKSIGITVQPGYTVLYSEDNATWSETAPLYTDAGSYSVYVKAFKDGNPVWVTKSAEVKIDPVPVVNVTVNGATETAVYDGTKHEAEGYSVTTDHPLYKQEYIRFSGAAHTAWTDAGKAWMGLRPKQFENTSENFQEVNFIVSDGFVEITPKPVTVQADNAPKEGPFTATVTGTLGSDTVTYSLDVSADGTRIIASGAAYQGNYVVTYKEGVVLKGDIKFKGIRWEENGENGVLIPGGMTAPSSDPDDYTDDHSKNYLLQVPISKGEKITAPQVWKILFESGTVENITGNPVYSFLYGSKLMTGEQLSDTIFDGTVTEISLVSNVRDVRFLYRGMVVGQQSIISGDAVNWTADIQNDIASRIKEEYPTLGTVKPDELIYCVNGRKYTPEQMGTLTLADDTDVSIEIPDSVDVTLKVQNGFLFKSAEGEYRAEYTLTIHRGSSLGDWLYPIVTGSAYEPIDAGTPLYHTGTLSLTAEELRTMPFNDSATVEAEVLYVTVTDTSGQYKNTGYSITAAASLPEAKLEYSVDGGQIWVTQNPEFADVSPEPYEIRVRANLPGVSSKTVVGHVDITPKPVTVQADNAPAEGPFTATVSGTLGSDTITYDLRLSPDGASIIASGEIYQGNYVVTYKEGRVLNRKITFKGIRWEENGENGVLIPGGETAPSADPNDYMDHDSKNYLLQIPISDGEKIKAPQVWKILFDSGTAENITGDPVYSFQYGSRLMTGEQLSNTVFDGTVTEISLVSNIKYVRFLFMDTVVGQQKIISGSAVQWTAAIQNDIASRIEEEYPALGNVQADELIYCIDGRKYTPKQISTMTFADDTEVSIEIPDAVDVTLKIQDGFLFARTEGGYRMVYTVVMRSGSKLGKWLYPIVKRSNYEPIDADIPIYHMGTQSLTAEELRTMPMNHSAAIDAEVLYVTVTDVSGTYKNAGYSIKATASLPEATLEYSVDGGQNWATHNPEFADASPEPYEVQVRANLFGIYSEVVIGHVTIAPARVNATAEPLSCSKIFGEDDPDATVDVQAAVYSGTVAVRVTLEREPGENTGTYRYLPTEKVYDNNYIVVAAPAEGSCLTIQKRKIVFKVNDAEKKAGTQDPEWTYTITNQPNQGYNLKPASEVVSPADIKFTVKREEGENLGQYNISATGSAEQGNFSIVFQCGTLTIH